MLDKHYAKSSEMAYQKKHSLQLKLQLKTIEEVLLLQKLVASKEDQICRVRSSEELKSG